MIFQINTKNQQKPGNEYNNQDKPDNHPLQLHIFAYKGNKYNIFLQKKRHNA